MTFPQFITTWLGKKCDFDGAYGGQCVDLFRRYVQDVLLFPQPKGVVGAADFWTNYPSDPALNKNFERIPNTPTGVPRPGDVMIFSKKINGNYGHISIYIEGDVNSFVSFDQNFPTPSKCTRTRHTYNYVLGWLRPRTTVAPTPQAYWAQANDTLHAFTGKDNNNPDASTLADYWNKGDRRSKDLIDEYRRKYPLI